MKTPILNAALQSANPQESAYKVTLNADGGNLSHTELALSPNGVRAMLKKYPSLANGRMIVKAISDDGHPSRVIFDGMPS